MTELSLQDARHALQRIWGYSDFRPPQAEVIQAIIQGQDALIILPTGGGKSLCFQLPSILKTGLTLVISPLLALIENQVAELRERNLAAAAFHSECSRGDRQRVLHDLDRQKLRLLYLSPESLFSPKIWQRLIHPDLLINGLILDEAHCLVQWGDSFRPAYRRLGTVRPALEQAKPHHPRPAIAAFTATADHQVRQTIEQVLGLKQPHRVCLNPYRANLSLGVKSVCSRGHRRQQVIQFIRQQRGTSGLVYGRSRRDCETLAQTLNELGWQTLPYHGGLSAGDRRSIEQDWISNQLPFVVCTSAFGMGVNKPDVRWVCHYQAPLHLGEYIQEVGRAGRDGNAATALTLISEPTGWLDPEDRQRQRFFQQQAQAQRQEALDLANRLPRQGSIQEISQRYSQGAIALALLHQQGRLVWTDPFHYQMKPTPQGPTPPLTDASKTDLGQMQAYVHYRGCRWQALLQAFGFLQEAHAMACGRCDNCKRQK
ncbi:RecQ family ATP-dependent DNA helicase [Candidatus Synechococcus calcipolaris G9]|uniref:ATP-dependent DNA helicase RecQ n=1 Tax=Candidatus Synechococcus calcipolaris G9 TaxID=1497997 RepID=A0ABT6EYZ8_9SYNE|nr:RecQ family ATP-dependent DNA helicase [Candidatus Synechococcus calcipolaris]MDG2990711.1 RecQ family ATP-dependent DNA helicase [Candidatus Synechococcus calcipolaris G9]